MISFPDSASGAGTDGEREYADDSDPLLGSGTAGLLAAASEHRWVVVDMATDWSSVFPHLEVIETQRRPYRSVDEVTLARVASPGQGATCGCQAFGDYVVVTSRPP